MGSESPDMPSSNHPIGLSETPDGTPIGSGGVDRPRILITAGPTHEPLDGVRYLANRSSGRLGLTLAAAATRRGAATTLLLGPTPLEPTDHSLLTVERFQTTADLEHLLGRTWPEHDLLLMAAAVADFRPKTLIQDGKHQRAGDGLTLELEATPDLLAGLRTSSRPDQTRVGWALEPHERLLERSRMKLESKGLHAIVGNPIQTIDSERIEPTLLVATSDGPQSIPHPVEGPVAKDRFADWLLDQCLDLHGARTAPSPRT